MEDLMEQANEVQETLGRSYNLPDDIDEDDLEAGEFDKRNEVISIRKTHTLIQELDALGDELEFEDEEVPSYLQEDELDLPKTAETDPKLVNEACICLHGHDRD